MMTMRKEFMDYARTEFGETIFAVNPFHKHNGEDYDAIKVTPVSDLVTVAFLQGDDKRITEMVFTKDEAARLIDAILYACSPDEWEHHRGLTKTLDVFFSALKKQG